MPSLHDLQSKFSGALLNPEAPLPHPLVGRGGEEPTKRFAVYRNNVAVSLVEALVDGYPAIFSLVGEEFFRAIAQIHTTENPPKSAVLLFYGAQFPDFLRHFPPAATIPYLGDVAQLEFAWRLSYHASDEEPLPISTLNGILPDDIINLRFSFHPATQLITSPFPIVSLWKANTQENENDNESDQEIDLTSAECALITRPHLDVEVRTLPPGADIFITSLQQGNTLSEAAERASEQNEYFDLTVNIGGLFEAGAISSIDI